MLAYHLINKIATAGVLPESKMRPGELKRAHKQARTFGRCRRIRFLGAFGWELTGKGAAELGALQTEAAHPDPDLALVGVCIWGTVDEIVAARVQLRELTERRDRLAAIRPSK